MSGLGRRTRRVFRRWPRVPVWLSLSLAVGVCVALTWGLPALLATELDAHNVVILGRVLSLPLTGLLLATAVWNGWRRGWRKRRERRLLARTTDLARLHALSWQDLECLVGAAFRRRGYRVEVRGGAAPDGGIDLRLRRQGRVTVVQCKHWHKTPVGVSPVRELYGIMHDERAVACIFVATAGYTAAACEFAHGKPIDLLDGAALLALIRESPPARPPAAVTPAGPAPFCPTCGGRMVPRVARRGSLAGQHFWGCARYPDCRGTRAALEPLPPGA